MTTILGIDTRKDGGGVVMASDLQGTSGDQKGFYKKLHVNDNRNSVLGVSGIYDEQFRDFLGNFMTGKIDIEKIVKRGRFKELVDLNLKRLEGRMFPVNGNFNGVLLGTNVNGKPELYTCWPLGRVESRAFTCIGSGSKFVEEYLGSKNVVLSAEGNGTTLNSDNLSLEEGIDLAETAASYATADLYSVGFDLVILSGGEIFETPELYVEGSKGRAKALKQIKQKVKK